METIPGRRFTKQQVLQANDKLYEDMKLPTKRLDFPLNTEIIKQAHGLMMEDEKDVLGGVGGGGCRKLYFRTSGLC